MVSGKDPTREHEKMKTDEEGRIKIKVEVEVEREPRWIFLEFDSRSS
jgi:hypothetical protein